MLKEKCKNLHGKTLLLLIEHFGSKAELSFLDVKIHV